MSLNQTPGTLTDPSAKGSSTLLEARDLGKTISDAGHPLTILADINFSLRAGESAAIVGPSGSGKSTLLGLLAGLDRPTQGDVYWQGTPFSAWNEDALAAWRAAHVGFVFQSFQLLGHLTALENVQLPLELASLTTLHSGHEIRSRAQAMLERVGLGARLGHLPRQLSGGEQQRVALARAFVSQPQILFADEPTGSLDEIAGERMMDLLFELNQAQGSTLVLVTHAPVLAARCAKTIRLHAGTLA